MHAQLFLHIGNPCLGRIDREGHAQLFGQRKPLGFDVGDHHMARRRVAYHRGCHNPNRTRARDQYVFAQHRERQRRVNGIAERIEDRRHFQIDIRVVPPDVRHRQHDEFREGTGAIHSHAHRVRAKMPPPGETVAAAPANHVAFSADDVPRLKVVHIRADFRDLSDELVANNQRHRNRRLRPTVPFVDMQVRAANSGDQHADLHIIDTRLRRRDVFQPQTRFSLALHQRFHLPSGSSKCSTTKSTGFFTSVNVSQ